MVSSEHERAIGWRRIAFKTIPLCVFVAVAIERTEAALRSGASVIAWLVGPLSGLIASVVTAGILVLLGKRSQGADRSGGG